MSVATKVEYTAAKERAVQRAIEQAQAAATAMLLDSDPESREAKGNLAVCIIRADREVCMMKKSRPTFLKRSHDDPQVSRIGFDVMMLEAATMVLGATLEIVREARRPREEMLLDELRGLSSEMGKLLLAANNAVPEKQLQLN